MSINNIIVLNEKVLIEPCDEIKTNAGLVIPQHLKDKDNKERIECGSVIKVGKGYPLFNNTDNENVWENASKGIIKFIPLQVKEKDFVYYLGSQTVDFFYDNKKYIIIPEYCILLIDRNSQVKNEIKQLIGE